MTFFISGGNFNTDFSLSDSLHTIALGQFVTCGTMFIPDNSTDNTYESKITGDHSTLDHFLISENLSSFVTNYGSIPRKGVLMHLFSS